MHHARGFFTPSLVAALLVVIFIAVLFGTRVTEKSGNFELRYSDRYHELRARARRSAEEEAELELETCRYRRDLVIYLKSTDAERYREALAGYAPACGQILPLG